MTNQRDHLFDGLQSPFGRRELSRNPRISLTGNIYSLGEGLEQGFHNVMRFVAIKQFQMQVAPRFVGHRLKKLPRQTESNSADAGFCVL